MIDLGNPIRREHVLAQGLQFFGLGLPTLSGGAKLWNLCDVHRLTGRHAVLSGMSPPWKSGAAGWQHTSRIGGDNELRFIAGTEYGEIARTQSLLLFGRFTVALCLYWVSSFGSILTKESNTAGFQSTTSGDNLYCTDNAVPRVGTPLTERKWMHVALVSNSGGSILYINGQVKDTGATFATFFNFGGSPIRIGRGNLLNGFHTPFIGAIDAITMYNRALSPQEIQGLYKETQTYFPTLLRHIGRIDGRYLFATSVSGGVGTRGFFFFP